MAYHAVFAIIFRHVYFSVAVFVTESLVHVDLVQSARRARKPAMPHKVEDALSGGVLERISDDHLREVVRMVLVVGVALVLDVRLIFAAGV